MSYVEKLPHKCGSSDGLQTNFDSAAKKYWGYCFACDTFVADPYENGKGPAPIKPKVAKSKEELEADLAEIRSLSTVSLEARHLRKESLEHFGVKVALSEQDGSTPVVSYYPIYSDGVFKAYKARLLQTKQFWAVGSLKGENDLFGWEQALASGGKRLFITEGENDAVALYQALRDKQRGSKWEHLHPAVTSLVNGAGGARRNIAANLSKIRANFKEVVLVFDNDEAGVKATQDVLQILPTARTVTLPAKDPNAAVIEGRSIALCNAVLFKAETPKNTRLVWGQSLYQAARQQAPWGLSWPWEGMTKLTRGIRFGETYYLGAGVKMGKSELVNTIASHLIVHHGLKVFMAKPEEANVKTIKLLAGKVAGKIFHDPEVEFDYDAYDKAVQTLGDNVCLLNLYQHLGWDSLRADIMVAVEQGCKAVFIDPITNLTNGVSSGDTNTMLQEIAQELAAIALDLDIIIWIFCHLKAPESGDSHERGGKVLSHQFAGSRAMMRSCNMMIGLEGNKDPDLPEEMRNTRKLIILEDREFGVSGGVKLFWDKNTSLFTEIRE